MGAPFLLLAAASASCSDHYSCCCQYDFFIPVMCECIENEPATGFLSFEKDNCARADRSKVAWWQRLETAEWRKDGICTANTTVVTRKQLEAAEAKEKAFQEEYDKFCIHNAANCSVNEFCYVDGRRRVGEADEYVSMVIDKGPVCVCGFPAGREHVDGTGACLPCKAGPDGQPAYVQKNTSAGARMFHNGEFACALGLNISLTSVLV